MTHRGVPGRVLLMLVLMALPAGGPPAGASSKWDESKEPVYAQPEPGRALVYVLRDNSPPDPFLRAFEVFLDDVPLGFLKGRKYLHAQAEPGPRLLWGPRNGHPVTVVLEAGRTYVFRIEEVWEMRGAQAGGKVLKATSWRQEEAGAINGLVERSRLEHVQVTADGVGKLRAEAAKGIEEARRSAVPLEGTAVAVTAAVARTLPHTFEGVLYRPEKVGFQVKVFKSRGALKVAGNGIEFTSDDDHLAIPIGEVRSIARGPLGVNRDISWVILEYASPEGPKVAGFAHPRDASGIEATLREAMDRPRLSPMDQVRKAIGAAVAFEESGSMDAPDLNSQMEAYGAADRIRVDLRRVDPMLSGYLQEHPGDFEALLLQSRLDRALDMLGPVVISGGKVRNDPLGPKRDPHAALDQILQADPDHAEAHYLKARLHGLTDPLTGTMRNPDKALQHARLAVEAEPGQMRYLEALAIYLMEAGKETEARVLFLKSGRADHPLVVLSEDRTRIPIPAGSTPLPEQARNMARYYAGTGTLHGYPFLRVAVHAVAMSPAQVETYYRQRWPAVRINRERKGRKDDRESSAFTAFLEWSGTDLLPSEVRPEKSKDLPSGVLLTVLESRDLDPEVWEKIGKHSVGETVVITINFRDLSHYRP